MVKVCQSCSLLDFEALNGLLLSINGFHGPLLSALQLFKALSCLHLQSETTLFGVITDLLSPHTSFC